MKACISPPELDEKQLFMYLDGEANAETTLHLQNCSFCLDRAKALDRFQKRLTSRIYRVTCPSSAELGEYHLRLLPASQMLVIAQHLRECPLCRREITELESFLDDLAPKAGILETAKVLVAQLIGSASRSALALRGQIKGPLTFEADSVVITLDIQPDTSGQVSIYGQIAADNQDEWVGALVKLIQADMPELAAHLDDLGAFGFEQVRPGSIRIMIISPNGIEVHIPDVDIAI